MKKVIIATIKSWNILNSSKFKEDNKSNLDVFVITKKEDLSLGFVDSVKPDFIFLPHWSWIIPKSIYEKYKCIVFHMTDLPFGRGGSPLQNLIKNKIYETKISAIKVVKDLDAGDVYMKEPVYIGLGSAEEIFKMCSEKVFSKIIPYIIKNNPEPLGQAGEVVTFKRRKPEESDMLKEDFNNICDIYDFIRMLDAEDYPKAFFVFGKFKITLNSVCNKGNGLFGHFEIIEKEKDKF